MGEGSVCVVERLTWNKVTLYHLLVGPPSFVNLGGLGLCCEGRSKQTTNVIQIILQIIQIIDPEDLTCSNHPTPPHTPPTETETLDHIFT